MPHQALSWAKKQSSKGKFYLFALLCINYIYYKIYFVGTIKFYVFDFDLFSTLKSTTEKPQYL